MTHAQTVADHILEVLTRYPECSIEELLRLCPDLTWNQVFLEVDRLSRTRQVRLRLSGIGIYTVRLLDQKTGTATSIGREAHVDDHGASAGHASSALEGRLLSAL